MHVVVHRIFADCLLQLAACCAHRSTGRLARSKYSCTSKFQLVLEYYALSCRYRYPLHVQLYYRSTRSSPAGPGFTVKRPIRKAVLAPLLHSRLILLLLASRIWRALHESVNFVHDPKKQYKSLSVAHRPGGLLRRAIEPLVTCLTRFDQICTYESKERLLSILRLC